MTPLAAPGGEATLVMVGVVKPEHASTATGTKLARNSTTRELPKKGGIKKWSCLLTFRR
jgi:hypothetical protein